MWLRLCGGALLCAVAILLLKSAGGTVLPLQWTGTIVLTGAALLMLSPVITWLGELCKGQGVSELATLMIKGLGVAMLTQFCADLCRQSGEAALAGSVELAGKAELLLLCLPMLHDLVELAQGMLEGM